MTTITPTITITTTTAITTAITTTNTTIATTTITTAITTAIMTSTMTATTYVTAMTLPSRLRSLGERNDMDITIDGFHSWMWKGLVCRTHQYDIVQS